jgi:hypothetical protein
MECGNSLVHLTPCGTGQSLPATSRPAKPGIVGPLSKCRAYIVRDVSLGPLALCSEMHKGGRRFRALKQALVK